MVSSDLKLCQKKKNSRHYPETFWSPIYLYCFICVMAYSEMNWDLVLAKTLTNTLTNELLWFTVLVTGFISAFLCSSVHLWPWFCFLRSRQQYAFTAATTYGCSQSQQRRIKVYSKHMNEYLFICLYIKCFSDNFFFQSSPLLLWLRHFSFICVFIYIFFFIALQKQQQQKTFLGDKTSNGGL